MDCKDKEDFSEEAKIIEQIEKQDEIIEFEHEYTGPETDWRQFWVGMFAMCILCAVVLYFLIP